MFGLGPGSFSAWLRIDDAGNRPTCSMEAEKLFGRKGPYIVHDRQGPASASMGCHSVEVDKVSKVAFFTDGLDDARFEFGFPVSYSCTEVQQLSEAGFFWRYLAFNAAVLLSLDTTMSRCTDYMDSSLI